MRKLLTLIIMSALVTVVVAQRSTTDYQRVFDIKTFETDHLNFKENDDLFWLYPGNWENAEEAATYRWTDDYGSHEGYIFGTNMYNDKAYGQIFEIDDLYYIHGAVFWIGERYGEEGEVVFTVWDFDDGTVLPELGSKSVSMADIVASDFLDEAFYVVFDEPIKVISDFMIGADLSGLNQFEANEYGIGNVSSVDGEGANAGLAWILEGGEEGWGSILDYNLDVDIAIFPLVDYVSHEVSFVVDMADVVTDKGVVFDPESHDVYISGTFADWAKPGEDEAYMLEPDIVKHKNKEELIYYITLDNIKEGEHNYKYFIVEDEPTWDLGEWGDEHPDRTIMVADDLVMNDIFGVFPPFVNPTEANFDLRNPADVETTITWSEANSVSEITLDGDLINETNDYTITDIDIDSSTLKVNKDVFSVGEHRDSYVFKIHFDVGSMAVFKVNIVDTEVSVEEPVSVASGSIKVYPNPVRDILNIDYSGQINEIRLFDISGRMVLNKTVNSANTSVNVSEMNHGIYILQAITSQGVYSRKVQISR